MKTEEELIRYLHSNEFLLDTMVHREGDKYVYLEHIHMSEWNTIWHRTPLAHCRRMVKHVGTLDEIADLIDEKLGITKNKYWEAFFDIRYNLQNLPNVINADEVK